MGDLRGRGFGVRRALVITAAAAELGSADCLVLTEDHA